MAALNKKKSTKFYGNQYKIVVEKLYSKPHTCKAVLGKGDKRASSMRNSV